MVEYSNDGNYITTHWLPTKDNTRGAANAQFADGYGYDARVLPRKNALLTSSFTGWNNYTMDFGKMTSDPEAMKHFGQTMVMWDFHTRQPKKVFQVPGAPLEIRWAWGDQHNYAFTATALGSKLWLIYADDHGDWQAKDVAPIGEVKGGVLPVDISLSADDKTLFVDSFGDGKCRVFDVSDPQHPKQIYEKQIGKQVNMVSQSWDGKRLYFTSSLLANWDKKGADNEQFLRAFAWDGKELQPTLRSRFHRAQARTCTSYAFRLNKTWSESYHNHEPVITIADCDAQNSHSYSVICLPVGCRGFCTRFRLRIRSSVAGELHFTGGKTRFRWCLAGHR